MLCACVASAAGLRMPAVNMQLGGGSGSKTKLLVIGGNGFVGREVCKYAVQAGFEVTSLSRRGQCPKPDDEFLSQVSWNAGNALDKATITKYVNEADAVVHAIGLLFDVNSGLTFLNTFTSASASKPDEGESTYDNITRKAAILAIDALKAKNMLPSMMGKRAPFAFVSCAESGWPDVQFGDRVEAASPDWLKRYLAAKRAVESELMSSTGTLRPVIVRPSLIWNWRKLDVLPVIPVFNVASRLGKCRVAHCCGIQSCAPRGTAAFAFLIRVSSVAAAPEGRMFESHLSCTPVPCTPVPCTPVPCRRAIRRQDGARRGRRPLDCRWAARRAGERRAALRADGEPLRGVGGAQVVCSSG